MKAKNKISLKEVAVGLVVSLCAWGVTASPKDECLTASADAEAATPERALLETGSALLKPAPATAKIIARGVAARSPSRAPAAVVEPARTPVAAWPAFITSEYTWGESAQAIESLSLARVIIPAAPIFKSFDLYQKGRFSMGIEGGVGTASPTSATSDQARAMPIYCGDLYLQQMILPWMKIETGAHGQTLAQDAYSADNSMDMGVYFKIRIPLGGKFK